MAISIFTSLGYGTEEDDVAILTTLQRAVRPGGVVFIETNHRDTAVAFYSRVPRRAAIALGASRLLEGAVQGGGHGDGRAAGVAG